MTTPIFDQLSAELAVQPRHALGDTQEWVPDWPLSPPVHGQDGPESHKPREGAA